MLNLLLSIDGCVTYGENATPDAQGEWYLRCYLISKGVDLNTLPEKDFFHYIEKCKQEGFLKKACANLSDARREFRNLVHIEKEVSKRDTISSTNALGTITDIFTVADDFH